MQTTTLNASKLPQLRLTGSSSAWSAELWKDYRQVRQPVGSILLGLFTVQMLFFLAGLFIVSETERANVLGMMMTIALLSPVLVTIACAGMLIGHERQTGTWGWNSVLPHSWQQSLGIKLLVAIVSTVVVFLVLAILPTIEYLSSGRASNDRWEPAVIWMAGILVADCLAFYFLALLLFRDTLTGLLVATVAMLLMQLVAASTPLFIGPKEINQVDSDYTFWLLTISLPVLLFGFAAMATTFRWRWGMGQTSTFRWPSSRAVAAAPVQALRRDNLSPGEFPMLMNLSWRNFLALRICLAIVLAGIALVGHPSILAWLGLSCLLYGITAFDGDQNRARFRFLADRGVSPRQMVTSRLIVPFAFVVISSVLALLAAFAHNQLAFRLDAWNLLLVAGTACFVLILFLFGALTSLCFDKTVISTTLAICATATIAGLAGLLHSVLFNRFDVNPDWCLQYAIVLFVLIAIPLFTFSIYSCATSWLIEDRPLLGRRFIRNILIATSIPILLPICFGFLATPRVDWQGLAAPNADLQTALPKLAPAALLPSGAIFSGVDSALPRDFVDVLQLQQTIEQRIAGDEEFAAQGIIPLFEQRLDDLESELKDSSSTSGVKTTESIANLRSLLLESAAVVTTTAAQREYSVALRALRAHHQLQEIAAQYAAPETIYARVNSFKLLRSQVQDWGSIGERKQLIQLLSPNLFDSQEQRLQLVKSNAEAIRADLRSTHWTTTSQSDTFPLAIRLIPTLRWRQERQLAIGLQEAIDLIKGERMTNPTQPLASWFLTEYYAYVELTKERSLILGALPLESVEED